MNRLTLIALFLFSGLSCGILGEDENNSFTLYIEDIRSVEYSNSALSITVNSYLPDSCYEISEKVVRKKGNTFSAKILGVKEGGACFYAIIPFEEKFTFSVESGESYLFRFYRNEDATLDTTITIP